ncbi:hypothetical protein JX265_008362 [Neoarthrinium moseri]|uniref:Aflatoxin regulatory protein domain-containing protein n=1 Tax=Neoarthrinium moseri TaxID=1658444 RepID=A0A9P9WHU9_9PEZI|nr:hypothetical protein JX265_008362 [Neoarthrinium moseri]
MLDSSAHDYFSTVPVDLNFASPIQSYANTTCSSEFFPEFPLRGPRRSLAADTCVTNQSDQHFRSDTTSLSTQDLGTNDISTSNVSSATGLPLPHKQLFQELGNYQSQTLSQQPEGIKMALQLMGQLCCQEENPSYPDVSSSELESQANALVDESKAVVETVNEMLQCPGSEDGYFLVVVCLVISKVLNAYAKATQALSARERDAQRNLGSSASSVLSVWSAPGTESASSASPTINGRDPKVAQQLLDDLYQVRTSMNNLGAKIIFVCSKRDWLLGSDITPSGHDLAIPSFPFSAAVLNQLHDELQRRLSAISLRLINELKQSWAQ